MGQQGPLEVVAALTVGMRRFQSMGEILALQLLPAPPSQHFLLLTRSAGGFERMMGVFCMTDAPVSSLPSCGEGGQLLHGVSRKLL